jgi:hypothetical protein
MVATDNRDLTLKKVPRLITLVVAMATLFFLHICGCVDRFVAFQHVVFKSPSIRGSGESGDYPGNDGRLVVEDKSLEQNDQPENAHNKTASVQDGQPTTTKDQSRDKVETKTVSSVKTTTANINPSPGQGNNEYNYVSTKSEETNTAMAQDKPTTENFCHLCEDLLGRNATWYTYVNKTSNAQSIAPPSALRFPPFLKDRAHKCGFVSGRTLSQTETMETLQSVGPILFIGNSVFRRTMFAITHLAMGDDKAILNPIANDHKLIGRYGYQRIYDRKVHEGLLELSLNAENLTIRYSRFDKNESSKIELMRTSRRLGQINGPVLGSAFMSTPPEHQAQKLIKACNEDPTAKSKFPSKLCANYNVLVIQLMNGIGSKRTPNLINATAKLIKQNPSLRVIFVGVAHAIGNPSLLETQKWLDEEVWPNVRRIGAEVMDVTASTFEAIGAGKIHHEGTNAQHFMDQGRLLMASLVLNRLRMEKCDGRF